MTLQQKIRKESIFRAHKKEVSIMRKYTPKIMFKKAYFSDRFL